MRAAAVLQRSHRPRPLLAGPAWCAVARPVAARATRFLLSSTPPGLEELDEDGLADLSRTAAEVAGVLRDQGHELAWVRSYVAGDTLLSVYEASDDAAVRLHAESAGLEPVDYVLEISALLAPSVTL